MKRKKREAPLLMVAGTLGEPDARKLIRETLAIAGEHIRRKRDAMALETVRVLHSMLEPRPVTITNCVFTSGEGPRAKRPKKRVRKGSR